MSKHAVICREVQDQTSEQLTGLMRTTDAIFLIRESHNQVHFTTFFSFIFINHKGSREIAESLGPIFSQHEQEFHFNLEPISGVSFRAATSEPQLRCEQQQIHQVPLSASEVDKANQFNSIY